MNDVTSELAEAKLKVKQSKFPLGVFKKNFAELAARLDRDPTVPPPQCQLIRAEISGVSMVIPDRGHEGSLERKFRNSGSFDIKGVFLRHQLAKRGFYIDIGGNVGLTSLPHAILEDFTGIVAIEPEPLNFACLHYNTVVNRLTDRIRLVHAAIGAAAGTANLTLSKKSGTHFVQTGDNAQPVETIPVPMKTVDHIAAELGAPIALIKCDTQGHEDHILTGAQGLLERRTVPWHLEFWPIGIDRAGGSIDHAVGLIQKYFSCFADCRANVPDLVPIEAFGRYAEPRSFSNGKFTDFLLLP